jgi:PilZ domain
VENSWQTGSVPSRRLYSRLDTSGNIWVYWNCDGKDDVSPILDISLGGLFLKTPTVKPVGAVVKLHFLVQEGQIRADAVIKHVRSGSGVGMKFAAVSQEDRPRLASLMARLRGLSRGNRPATNQGD